MSVPGVYLPQLATAPASTFTGSEIIPVQQDAGGPGPFGGTKGAPPEQLRYYKPTPSELTYFGGSWTAPSPQFEPYSSFRYASAAQILDTQTGGLVTDWGPLMAAITSIRQASGAVYAKNYPGTYGVKTGWSIQYPIVWDCRGAVFVPTATSAASYMLQWQAGFSSVYSLQVNGNYNPNVATAILWNSLGSFTPAQSNQFFDLDISRALSAIIFGSIPGSFTGSISGNTLTVSALSGQISIGQQLFGAGVPTLPITTITAGSGASWTISGSPLSISSETMTTQSPSAVQSENYITGCHISSCQNPLTVNQPNGILTIAGGGMLNCDGGNWPGGVLPNPSASYIVAVGVGALSTNDIAMEKPAITAGQGIINTGGALQIRGGSPEIACQPLLLAGGYTDIDDIAGQYFNNSINSLIKLNGTLTPTPRLRVGNYVVNKDVSTSAAATAVIDLGGYTGWDISFSDCRFENFLNFLFNNGSSQPGVWSGNSIRLSDLFMPLVGSGTAPLYPYLNTDVNNLLDLRGTDTDGIDITTWYHHDQSGAGTLSLNADAPSSNFPASYQCAATGVTDFTSLDVTSLATCKNTGVKCKIGDQFLISGWFRMTSAGTASVEAMFAGTTGVYASSVPIATQATLVANAWVFISGFVTATSAGYMGIGMQANATTVRMVGLKASKLA